MADIPVGKKKLTTSVVVAIIGVSAATILGGVTIWDSSAYQKGNQDRDQDRQGC